MVALVYLIVIVAGYLLGSIPTGYLVGRIRGIDIRTVGSGNIGATNVLRALGKRAGAFVLFIDGLKGWGACILASELAALWPGWFGAASAPALEHLTIVAGIAAILGHNYTCWLRFKGGKGIATTGGVLLAWTPLALLICFLTWLVVLAISRYVSLASIAAAVALPIGVVCLQGSVGMQILTTVVGALAVYQHKANLQRLFRGTEPRLGSKPAEGESND